MAYPFQNLIFEGGGVKGIAYVGALRALKQRDILKNIERVGGTSAGAINALLLSLGYSLQEMEQILFELDFNNFLDDSWGVVRDTNRLINQYGWYRGDFFRTWIGELIREKTGNEYSTFNHLKRLGMRDLYLVGTNLSTGYFEVFSTEHTPRMRVQDAVRISMSIPLFFTAIRTQPREDVYVDGGVQKNYPIKIFDRMKYIPEDDRETDARRTKYYEKENQKFLQQHPESSPYVFNRQTLGFRLDSSTEIGVFRDGAEPPVRRIDSLFDYIKALVQAIMNLEANQHLHSDDWHRTVYIDTIGVGTVDFDIDDDTKNDLLDQGREGVEKYFEWYDQPGDETDPVNRPEHEENVQPAAPSSPGLEDIEGIGPRRSKILRDAGIDSVEAFVRAEPETLSELLSRADVSRLQKRARRLLPSG